MGGVSARDVGAVDLAILLANIRAAFGAGGDRGLDDAGGEQLYQGDEVSVSLVVVQDGREGLIIWR